MTPILICTDLDRTLLPNGPQPESPAARRLFRQIAARPEVRIAYVSGRDRGRVERAIADWDLPLPEVAATDVGTRIYSVGRDADWAPWPEWEREIDADWHGRTAAEIAEAMADIPGLVLQSPEHQGPHKISFTAPADCDVAAVTALAARRAAALGITAEIGWSVDETVPIGLLDVLPRSATKRGAVAHLMRRLGFSPARTLFAGDSGNDLPVLAGPFLSVLVANATDEVRAEATRLAGAAGNRDSLYPARGGFLGMNGAYAAGILEGLAHFFPETLDWMA